MQVPRRTTLPRSVHEAAAREPVRGGMAALRHVVFLTGENDHYDDLADTFTVCDAFHGSGYPWATYAVHLRDAGKSWRVYQDGPSFRADVESGGLPQVSYLVPPPAASWAYEVLDALASVPEVWDSTALFIDYGSGHDGEHGSGGAAGGPFGLGPRVPVVVVSPWTVGGYVDSQVFDQSSAARFVERWLGVSAPGIGAPQRTACGDLTSAFDFGRRRPVGAHLPGWRPARPLPYQPDASGAVVGGEVRLGLRNSGDESVRLALHPHAGDAVHLDVRSSVEFAVPFEHEYRFAVVGPNGFRREFAGTRGEHAAVESSVHGHSRVLSMTLANAGPADVTFSLVGDGRDFKVTVRPGKRRLVPWLTAFRHGWYDLTVSSGAFRRRLAGHVENGRESVAPVITRS
ncbi:phospholipase domain-containing protein [Saccharothrix sp. NRRL B-16314]|uniref:phospholipase domain-containing protein n=1 Tax=Saccharothrix sp. NRRL B-16314 TaxID=1463825 RepID=UPI00068BDBFD|nr:phospholipase domain-containing protein [Saccharothrix sp. NRRL B-16314]